MQGTTEQPASAGETNEKGDQAMMEANAADGDNWQPISAAPKDATRILVTTFRGAVVFAAWDQCHCVWFETETRVTMEPGPRYWQPAPAPAKWRRR